jgi:hypothetical protein
MNENIDLSTPREFGEIISDTFVVIRQNFKPLLKSYFAICGLFLVANILVSALINVNRNDASAFTSAWFLKMLFSFVNHTVLVLTVLSYLAIYKDKGNKPAEVLEVWGYLKYYFFRFLMVEIVIFIATIIGFFLCFIPGIYLSVVFTLVAPIMVIENGGIEYSIKKAFKIIKENWWFTLGLALLMGIMVVMLIIILMLPGMILYGSAQWLTGKNLDNAADLIQSIVINLCQVLWFIPVISITMIYYTLTEEKEGNSLIDRINRFGKKPDISDQLSSEQF